MSHLTPGRNAGKPVTIPLLMFVIDHPKGLVVFDTGVATDELDDPFLECAPELRIDRQMLALGYSPGDVRFVVLSHLHFDHVGCMQLFPDATFVVRKQELRAAWWPDAYDGGYNLESLMKGRCLKYLQLATDEAFDLYGDGSIICIDTKGHSEGHQSLVVSLPESGRVVLAGDAAQVQEHLTENSTPGICWNSELAIRAVQRLRHLQSTGALVILGHELSALDTLKMAPEYYG
jgi:glyoxylase-like metal-dependent hydrolase (beta-lactamase superfamily II)